MLNGAWRRWIKGCKQRAGARGLCGVGAGAPMRPAIDAKKGRTAEIPVVTKTYPVLAVRKGDMRRDGGTRWRGGSMGERTAAAWVSAQVRRIKAPGAHPVASGRVRKLEAATQPRDGAAAATCAPTPVDEAHGQIGDGLEAREPGDQLLLQDSEHGLGAHLGVREGRGRA